jgi:hypothetical protein
MGVNVTQVQSGLAASIELYDYIPSQAAIPQFCKYQQFSLERADIGACNHLISAGIQHSRNDDLRRVESKIYPQTKGNGCSSP